MFAVCSAPNAQTIVNLMPRSQELSAKYYVMKVNGAISQSTQSALRTQTHTHKVELIDIYCTFAPDHWKYFIQFVRILSDKVTILFIIPILFRFLLFCFMFSTKTTKKQKEWRKKIIQNNTIVVFNQFIFIQTVIIKERSNKY